MYEARPTSLTSPLLEDHRRPPGHHLLHRATRHPRLHQVGDHTSKIKLDSLRLLAPSASPSTLKRGYVPRQDRPQPLPHRRYLWRLKPAQSSSRPSAGAVPTKPGSARVPSSAFSLKSSPRRANPSPVTAACSSSASPGPPWPAPSTATPSATKKLIGVTFPAATSPATARARTPMATSGSWPRRRCHQRLGHRLGTMEVESASCHPKVAEAAVVGRPDALKGQAIAALSPSRAATSPTKPSKTSSASGSRKRSALSPARTISGSLKPCPKPQRQNHAPPSCAELATHGEIKGDTTNPRRLHRNRQTPRSRRRLELVA